MSANLKTEPEKSNYLREMSVENLDEVMLGEVASYTHPWTQANFEDCLNNKAYSCWVFVKDKLLCGHVVFSVVLNEAHLLNICLYPNQQNQGWGRKLLSEIESVARRKGAQTCFLEVRPSNESGLHLYRSESYNEIGVRKNYYPTDKGREDAIVMAKSLVINSWQPQQSTNSA